MDSLHKSFASTQSTFLATYAIRCVVVVVVIFQVNHTVLLSTLGDSTYRFGTTYVGSKQTGPSEVRCRKVPLNIFPAQLFYLCCFCVQFFPVMVGDMDNSGSLNAQVIHQITHRIRSKVAFQVGHFSLDDTFSP